MEYIDAKNIVIKVKGKGSYWFGIDYNMNIYRGCCHGCIYCDSRSLCYRNADFHVVKAKRDALRIIRDNLSSKVKKGVVGTGAMSDPYNPFEKKYKLTRNALELLNAYGFGVAIDTKSPLIARDFDILKDIQKHSPVVCKITVTTANENLCKIIEPHALSTKHRFDAMSKLSLEGVYAGSIVMPILPFINDDVENIKTLVKQTKDSGGRFVYPSFGVTLRDVQRDYFYRALDANFPNIKEKYINRYAERYVCTSPNNKRLYAVLANECEKLGLFYKMNEITYNYKKGYTYKQLSLFP